MPRLFPACGNQGILELNLNSYHWARYRKAAANMASREGIIIILKPASSAGTVVERNVGIIALLENDPSAPRSFQPDLMV